MDLERLLKSPTEISTTNLPPDIILCSTTARAVIMAELTVPWEGGMEGGRDGGMEGWRQPLRGGKGSPFI